MDEVRELNVPELEDVTGGCPCGKSCPSAQDPVCDPVAYPGTAWYKYKYCTA